MAANGVILITTKKGARNQKAKITYDGYVGIQKASNVLELCNAHEYATMLLEGNYDAYQAHFKQSIDKYGVAMPTLIFTIGHSVLTTIGMINFYVLQLSQTTV
mgnify:FL=1